jgi:hypothetical protein
VAIAPTAILKNTKQVTWLAFHTTELLQGLYNDLDVSLKIPTVLISSLHHGLQRGI